MSYLFSEEFGISQLHFLLDVFVRPLALIGVSSLALLLCRQVWPGTGWLQLVGVGFSFAVGYALLAFWFVVDREHRQLIFEKIANRRRGLDVEQQRS